MEYPQPKFKIGDVVIVATSWGQPAGNQTSDQFIMAKIIFAYIYSGVWQYRLDIPKDLNPADKNFSEGDITPAQ